MLHFLSSTPLIRGLTTILLATSKDTKVLRVCTSPGCRDDGALGTLDRLTALASPCVKVVKGGCVSLCGSGPVVEICDNIDDVTSTKRKRVKGKAAVSLLDEFMISVENVTEQPFTSYMRDRLLGGYERFLEANLAFESKQYQSAVELYEEAIQNGRKPALALQEAREKYATSETESLGYPTGLLWLVQSFRNSCRSRLALGDIDGARRDAFAATVFSQNTDAASQECLADCCKASGDTMGEWQAVKASIESYGRLEEKYSQPLPGKDAAARAESAKIKNDAGSRKRELGFRLVKLERQLKA